MDYNHIATAYALAKVTGYEKSFNDFYTEYESYYNEAKEELASRSSEPSTVKVIKNPLRSR